MQIIIDTSLYCYKHMVMEKSRHSIKSGYQWRGRFGLEGVEGTFLGHGRVVLLERIKAYGSISQAARSMDMSFKHAKDLSDSMDRQAGCKLVVTARGGKSGGGAKLTSAGEKAIAVFWHYHERFQEVFQEMNTKLGDIIQRENFCP